MKKFMSATTAAALVLSAVSVPVSIVSAATETVTDSFGVVIQDMSIKLGETSVKIPVYFDSDVSFTVINLKLSTEVFPESAYVSKITSVESALPENSGVTVSKSTTSDSKIMFNTDGVDYTLKKGEVFAYVNVELESINPRFPLEKMDSGLTFQVTIDELDIADANHTTYAFSSEALSRAKSVTQVVSDGASDKHTLKIDVPATTTSKKIDIPVILNGEFGAFRTEFTANNGAKVVDVKSSLDGLTIESKELSMVYYDMQGSHTFKDEQIAVITVQLPDYATSGDEFTISTKYFDGTDSSSVNVYPTINSDTTVKYEKADVSGATISDIKIADKYVVSNGTDLDLSSITLTAVMTDASGNKTNVEFKAGGEYDINEHFEIVKEDGELEKTLELKYVGEMSAPAENAKVEYLRGLRGDVTLDNIVDARDIALICKHINGEMFGDTPIEDYIKANDKLKDVVAKYGIQTVDAFAKELGNADNMKNSFDARDMAAISKYINASLFDEVTWEEIGY